MTSPSYSPVVLDTDDSVTTLENETRIPLSQEWREAVRFGSRSSTFRHYVSEMTAGMPPFDQHGCVFMGSGDFHHLSLALVERCIASVKQQKNRGLRLVILDNHPDNMRFPWGIHCGSWVAHAARLPGIEHIHVIGITSGDLGLAHAWEHHLSALYKGRITYWCHGVDTRWAHRIGLGDRFRQFDTMETLVNTACELLHKQRLPTYLSIDKDVFSPSVVHTNWDQGQLTRDQFNDILNALQDTVIGSDVTGEVSTWRYKAAWKRWLSAADGQHTDEVSDELGSWQEEQNRFNDHILEKLSEAYTRS